MNEDLRYQKWQRWSKRIVADALFLASRRYVFNGIVEIMNANEVSKRPPVVFDWLGQVFSESALMHVRRQTDRKGISLWRLLDEIAATPHIITLARYRELYKDSGASLAEYQEYFLREVDNWFKGLVGPSGAIDAAAVRAEQAELDARTLSLRVLIDKRIAHHDQADVTVTQTWGELNRALDCVWDLASKYERLLNASNAMPHAGIPSVWTRIFEQPWKVKS